MQKVSKSHRDRQGPIWPGELVPEVVVGSELDGLLGGDQEDVDTAAPVHPKVALTKYNEGQTFWYMLFVLFTSAL